jgi:hypothetical protein
LIALGRVAVAPGTAGTERLQRYLLETSKLLARKERYGLPQSDLLLAAQAAEDLVSEGVRETLMSQLKGIRQSIRAKIGALAAVKPIDRTNFGVVAENATIVYGTDVRIGGNTMTTYEVRFGDHAVFTGNLVVANSIQDSFDKVQQSTAAPELKKWLETLSQSVAEMTKGLPEERAVQAAADLRTLTTEALSKEPRKKWYELSAEGLVEAAKAVGEVAAPVVTAVKAIIGLLAGSGT